MSPALQQPTHPDDYISTTAIFSEVKRNVLSENFQVGMITSVFGRTTIDFGRANISGRVVIDITQCFGEVRVKVPVNWNVMDEISNVLSTVKDNRNNTSMKAGSDKILIIKGIGIFSVVKIMDCIW